MAVPSPDHVPARAIGELEAIDLSLQAQLETELSLRRAEREAERARERARRAAGRRFLVVTGVLLGLVAGLAYLVVDSFRTLFGA